MDLNFLFSRFFQIKKTTHRRPSDQLLYSIQLLILYTSSNNTNKPNYTLANTKQTTPTVALALQQYRDFP